MVFFASVPDFEESLKKWAQDKATYALKSTNGYLHYQKFAPEMSGDLIYGNIRAVEPFKSFLFKASEAVAKYPLHSSLQTTEKQSDFIVVGAKSCDLRSIEAMDDAFMKGDIKEPSYVEARKNITIISSDCSSPNQSCFCTTLGLNPYPEKGFDLNLSRISKGLIVDIGSEKGEKLVSESKHLFTEASSYQIEERDKQRVATFSEVKEQNEKFRVNKPYEEIIREKLRSPVWNRYAGRCLECAACLSICPTCHCFLLHDQETDDAFERFRIWDFCYYRGFARVGGGSNARPTIDARFKNKYIKKFDFYPANFGICACSGCGRCIEACLAKIDMREVFKELDES